MSTPAATRSTSHLAGQVEMLQSWRRLALRGLARMYCPEQRSFIFRLARTRGGLRQQGLSRRYTAIVLIGLAREPRAALASIFGEHAPEEACSRLIDALPVIHSLGDAALILWAAALQNHPRRQKALDRLVRLVGDGGAPPTVELAWALAALCQARSAERPERDGEAAEGDSEQDRVPGLREQGGRLVCSPDLLREVAERLLGAFQPAAGLFPHRQDGGGGVRRHVACFADQVYPIQALSRYAGLTRDERMLAAAARCAERICALAGRAGQWWWHYDVRTGAVVEGYPVYAVHQDAMAPMALAELHAAGGPDHRREVARGLAWLAAPPELGGGRLVDEEAGVIWRKVARREPLKLARRLQALACAARPGWRVPGIEWACPPTRVDYECRPYHLGWLLHAWPPRRLAAWSHGEALL